VALFAERAEARAHWQGAGQGGVTNLLVRQPLLVEEFIDGREFHVAAWGNGTVTVLPAAEMDYGAFTDIRDRLFTYEGKYVPGSRIYEGVEMRVPAPLDAAARAELERIVLATYRAAGCRDYGRIDLRLRDGVPFVIDVNPNPDISPESGFIRSAARAGIAYEEVLFTLVEFALQRSSASARPVSQRKKNLETYLQELKG